METIGEMVAHRPMRARVFERFGIDYCCRGHRSLEEVCAEKGLDLKELRAEIEREDRDGYSGIDWTRATVSELIEHLLSAHHAHLRSELPAIERLIDLVVRQHGAKHPELDRVAALFAHVRTELEIHMEKEETLLFPICRHLAEGHLGAQSAIGGVQNPVQVMEHEHKEMGHEFAEIRLLTDGYSVPAGACPSYHALMGRLERLEHQLHDHIHLENNVLFPRVIAIGKGRMTDDWHH